MPVFTLPIHEHGTPGEPDYPHPMGKGASGAWAGERTRMTASRRAKKSPMRLATDAERRRLGIAPAYKNAMIATDPKAELRATAITAAGKVASYYSAAYIERQEAAKWSRVMGLHKAMPGLWAKIQRSDAPEAMTLRLILRTGLRNGGEGKGLKESFGASSLKMEHVSVDGDTIRLTFPGKHGIAQDHTFRDPILANYVRARQAGGATRLFDHNSGDTLSHLKKLSGGKFKVHDLRTWHATVLADALVGTAVANGLVPANKKQFKALQKQIATHVSKTLGNTPGMALSTYIHPAVFRPLEP